MPSAKIEEAIRQYGQAEDGTFDDVLLINLCSYISKLHNEITNEVLKPFELNYTSYRGLLAVYAAKDGLLNPSTLSTNCSESRANITRISDQLVKLGLITRVPSEDDRRKLVLSITTAGKNRVRKLGPLVWKRLNPAFAVLSRTEKKTLTQLLKKQLHGLEAIL